MAYAATLRSAMLRHCTAYDQGIARIGLIRNLSQQAIREESCSLWMDLRLRVCCRSHSAGRRSVAGG
jgi:hypothetical protein